MDWLLKPVLLMQFWDEITGPQVCPSGRLKHPLTTLQHNKVVTQGACLTSTACSEEGSSHILTAVHDNRASPHHQFVRCHFFPAVDPLCLIYTKMRRGSFPRGCSTAHSLLSNEVLSWCEKKETTVHRTLFVSEVIDGKALCCTM